MKRRLKNLCVLLTSIFTLVTMSPAIGDPVKPNIVVIFVDDMGYADIGPFGATKQATPNLNRMAREGMKLTSFYAATVCSASRAQLMTGCYQARVSVPNVFRTGDAQGLNSAEVTVAERLKTLGYSTACIGKWHLGDQPVFLPTRQGFDKYFGIPYSNDMQNRPASGGAAVVPLLNGETVTELMTEDQQSSLVQRYTNEAVSFINDNQSNPFFLYLAYNAIHTPVHPGLAFRGSSDNGRVGDLIEEVDWSVGQILDRIRSLNLSGQTLVLFTSDNGPWLIKGIDSGSASPLRGGKTTTWEGGCRVPAIAWWPGRITASSVSDVVMGTIDVLPTAVSLAGGTVPDTPVIDGRDVSSILFGNSTQSPRNAHFYFNGFDLQAVRQGPWKLAVAPQPDAFGSGVAPDAVVNPRLYNLNSDISEQINLAVDNPDLVTSLQALASDFSARIGGSQPPERRPAGQVANPVALFPLASNLIPVLTGPPLQNVTARPVFQWNTVPDAVSYEVWISKKTAVYKRQIVSDVSFTPAADMDLDEYRVWVQGIYSDGTRTSWSLMRNFTVAPRPVFTGPTGQVATSTPTLTWSSVAGASKYDLWVTNATTGQSQVIRNQNVAATKFLVLQPLPLGDYSVWVQPINAALLRGNWSMKGAFTIATPPALQAPVNNQAISGTPSFLWSEVPGSKRYDLWVRNLSTGADQVIRQTNLATPMFTPANPLPLSNYIWWVRAIGDKEVTGKWSIGGRFAVAP